MEFLAVIGSIIQWCVSKWFFILLLVMLGMWKLVEIISFLINHVKIV